MITTATAVGGLIGLFVSLAFLARQTKAISEQVKISTGIAGATALSNAMVMTREVYAVMLAHPELRPYFYDGKPSPRRGRERERVLIVAEMMADVMESNLLTSHHIEGAGSHEPWRSYCRFILAQSPTLRSMVTSHPAWWPSLAAL